MEAFRKVNRKKFVPIDQEQLAYQDRIIYLDKGASMTQPSLMARMMNHLELCGEEKVLEVGTGSGYQAALLSCCASEIHTIEFNQVLALEAQERLTSQNYNNVRVHIGDGALGLPQEAPFDAIIVTAGAKEIPHALISQLVKNGKIVIPVGVDRSRLDLIVGQKHADGTIVTKKVEIVTFHPLLSKHHGGWPPDLFKNEEEDRIAQRGKFLEQLAQQLDITVPDLRTEIARRFDIKADQNWSNNVDDVIVLQAIELILEYKRRVGQIP